MMCKFVRVRGETDLVLLLRFHQRISDLSMQEFGKSVI
jgi:hypothetical protein